MNAPFPKPSTAHSVGRWLRRPLKTVVAALARAQNQQFPKLSQRILIVRDGGLGDLILTVPIVRTLRRQLGTDVTIDALVRRQIADLYQDLQPIDRLFSKSSSFAETLQTIRDMRGRRYDLVVDLVLSPSLSFALWVVLAAPGARRIGGDKAELQGMYHQHIDLPPRPSIHFLERLRRISAGAFGDVPLVDEVPWIKWPDDVQKEAEKIWQESTGSLRSGPVVLINLSAGHPRRTWSDEKYRELMPRLLGHHGEDVACWIISAAPHEHHRATDLAAYCDNPRVVALPRIPDFRAVAALVGRMALVITPDTSIVHACSAHGTPVVMFTVAENATPWAPWGVEFELVAAEVGQEVDSIACSVVQERIAKMIARIQGQETE